MQPGLQVIWEKVCKYAVAYCISRGQVMEGNLMWWNLTGQTGSMALTCWRIKLSNTNYLLLYQPWSSLIWMACGQVILMKQLFSLNGKLKKWQPNAVLLKPKKWECRAQQCHVTALISPEVLFCESPPFLSSSRLSPSLWIPITVAVEGGLVTRKHKHCVYYSSDL